jgi:hypothetical protein
VCVATLHNAPTTVAGISMGWSDKTFGSANLPAELTSIGMPGCYVLQSNDNFGLSAVPVTATSLSFSYAIPNQPNLVGVHVYIQGYAFAPGQNPLSLVSSNAIDWRLGMF